jgi:hypothetical protein
LHNFQQPELAQGSGFFVCAGNDGVKQSIQHKCPTEDICHQEDGNSCASQLVPSSASAAQECTASCPTTRRMNTLVDRSLAPSSDAYAQECAASCPATNSCHHIARGCGVAKRCCIDTKRPVSTFVNTGHNTGDNLLSHPSVGALPSAVTGLTSVFEKGTCVSLHLWSPEWVS